MRPRSNAKIAARVAVYKPGDPPQDPKATGKRPANFAPGDKSFHEVNKADSHVTDYPLTMVIQKNPTKDA